MIIRRIAVTNRIVETGATNSLVENINEIVECKNNIALLMKKYTLVINKGGNYHKIIYNKFRKPDDFDYDKITCNQDRLTWYYDSIDGKAHHSEINTYRVLGIVSRLLDDYGVTFTTYNGYEVNHRLPRTYKEVNNVNNLEVCSDKENKRHYIAWNKCQIYENLIPIQISAIGDLVPFILSSDTKLVDKDDNYFTLRNYEWNGNIVEYTCKLNEDGVWRFNG